jgi:hypothetical protein
MVTRSGAMLAAQAHIAQRCEGASAPAEATTPHSRSGAMLAAKAHVAQRERSPGPAGLRAHSPRYAALTFGSLSSDFDSPLIVISPDSMT